MAHFPEFSYRHYAIKNDVLYDNGEKTDIEFIKFGRNTCALDKATINVLARHPETPYDESLFNKRVYHAVKMAVMLSYNYTNPTRSVDLIGYDYSRHFVDGIYDSVRDTTYLVSYNDYRHLNRLGLIKRYVDSDIIIIPNEANEHVYLSSDYNNDFTESLIRLRSSTGYDVTKRIHKSDLRNSKLILHSGYQSVEELFLDIEPHHNALVSLPHIELDKLKKLVLLSHNVFAFDFDSLKSLHQYAQDTKTDIVFRDHHDGFIDFMEIFLENKTQAYNDDTYKKIRNQFLESYGSIDPIKEALYIKRETAEKLIEANIFPDYVGLLTDQNNKLQSYIDNGSFDKLYENAHFIDKLKISKRPRISVFSDSYQLNISDDE